MNLMIVESPTKAKKISSILGGDWVVKASMGHIMQMVPKEYGIAVGTYELSYELSQRGKSVVGDLKPLAARAQEIYLATDPDREGEAISEHLRRNLRLSRYKRVTFNEITEQAVRTAISQPRQIDDRLVAAQEARRCADRMIGYRVSYPISDAAGMALSAGRCQSPAVRLVVEREDEITNFKVTDHFGAKVEFDDGAWSAEWQTKPFLPADAEYVLDQRLAERAAACRRFTVAQAVQKPVSKAPGAPYTTSALLQAAGATLRFPPEKTQSVAQKLFENGHITYHRTDNPNLSDDGVAAIAAVAKSKGWPLAGKLRRWKLPEGAQEAHEAIRPTHPELLVAGDTDDEKKLYALIWRQAVASQLADAVYNTITLDLDAKDGADTFTFRARSATISDPGWRVVLTTSKEAEPDKAGDEEETEEDSGRVPLLAVGNAAIATKGELLRKATRPPSRYTETSLIKRLEQLGIGRPSTYAAIVKKIRDEEYVAVQKRNLVPTAAGRAIVRNLVGRFKFVEYAYTKELETKLDKIADGADRYVPVVELIDRQLDGELGVLSREAPRWPCPACERPLRRLKSKRTGKPFFACTGYSEGCTVICEDNNGDPGPVIERNGKPSEKQLDFARKLAAETGRALTDEHMATAAAVSTWIEEAKAARPPRPATEGQVAAVQRIIDAKGVEPPKGWPDNLMFEDASGFLDAHSNKGGKGKPSGKKRDSKRSRK